MSNYVKATNFFSKDALLSGNPDKIIKGAEIDDEYNAIATAITTKADLNSPNFTGTPTAPTAPSGTNTTQVATTRFVQDATGTIAIQDADNVAITGGVITGITDLSVEDGGTGTSTLTANAVLLGNGTSAVQAVAPGTSGNVLTSNGTTWVSGTAGLGYGQTWQVVTGSRAKDTTYTNSTGKPIIVNIYVTETDSVTDVNLTVNGIVVFTINNSTGTRQTISAVVPNNNTYSVDNNFTFWVELR